MSEQNDRRFVEKPNDVAVGQLNPPRQPMSIGFSSEGVKRMITAVRASREMNNIGEGLVNPVS
jgi:hypothetical protein